MWYRIWNLWRKELTDGLRDRKALTQALLVPLLLGIFYAIFNPWISALIGERAREPVTIPPLPDADQWSAFDDARQAMLPNFAQAQPAERYRSVA